MAISIGDALLKLGVDTRDLDKGMQNIGNTIKKHQKAIGIGMVAAGGAILAAGALSVKTYAQMGDEVQKMALRTGFSTEALSELRHAAEISGASLSTLEKGVKRMSGTVLDAQDGLETYIRAFEHIGIEVKELDGLNPEQQFLRIAEAIAELEDPTKRAAIAQDIFGRAGTELLPLFAAGKEGLADLRQEAHDLGIVFDQEAANKAAKMTDAMHRVEEATSGLKMAIAEKLIPTLLPLIEKVKNVISNMSVWMKEHPRLTKVIVLGTAALGGLLIALGSLLLLMPGLTLALPLLGLAFHAALGPIGLITLAITGLIAAGILLWKNWDKVKNFLVNAWDAIKIAFATAVKFMVNTVLLPFVEMISKEIGFIAKGIGKLVGLFNKELGQSIDEFADRMLNARKEISDWADSLIVSTKVARDARKTQQEIGKLADGMVETLRGQLEEERDLKLKAVQESKDITQKEYDDHIEELRKTYGILEREDEEYQDTKLDAARKATDEMREQYTKDVDAARKATDEKIRLIDAEYAARLKLLDEETAAIISGYQKRIDAIDARTDAEEKAVKEAERVTRLAELEGAVESTRTEKERLEAIAELEDYQAKIDRERLLESRQDEKDALRDSINDAREAAANERDRLQDELEEKKTHEQALLEETVTRLEIEKEGLDAALKAELLRIDDERIAFEEAESNKLTAKLERLDEEEKNLTVHYEKQLLDAELHVAAINAATAQLKDRTVTVTTVHREAYANAIKPVSPLESDLDRYQHGGLIPEPTLLYGLRSLRPYAIAGEAGMERVMPIDGYRIANIIVQLDGRVIGRVIGQPLVDEIRVKTGVKI